jgi:hypothetical protein
MIQSDNKCVMIIDSALPPGIVANTAAILGITLGKHIPRQVGQDISDAAGMVHLGISTIPVPVLAGSASGLKALRSRLYEPEFESMIVADFSDVAQRCNSYDVYTAQAASTTEKDFVYLGLALYGEKKLVNKLTGSLPLLR